MTGTLKAFLESKKFVAALLSVVAVCLGHFGFNVDTSTMLLVLTPVMVAIGAQGWADSGKASAGAHDKPKQAGFIKRGLLVVVAVLGLTIGCSLFHTAEPIVTDAIDCVEQEAKASASGISLFDAIDAIEAAVIAASTDLEATLEAYIVKYGAPVVACTLKSYEDSTPGSAVSLLPSDARTRVDSFIKKHGWTFATKVSR